MIWSIAKAFRQFLQRDYIFILINSLKPSGFLLFAI